MGVLAFIPFPDESYFAKYFTVFCFVLLVIMNYFTPTQERIALVECASYNQRLLALRARRLAQQRMDYFHRMAVNEQEEAEEALNGTKPPINLGPAPQLTAESDDEEYELKEIHAPVPYQKGYWLAAKNAAKNRQRQQQQQGNVANRNAAHSRSQQRPNTNTQHHQRRSKHQLRCLRRGDIPTPKDRLSTSHLRAESLRTHHNF